VISFCDAVASVSRERLYLLNFDGFSIEDTAEFVRSNREKGLPHFIAIDGDKVVGWCDLRNQDFPIFKHTGTVGMGIIKEYRGQGIGEKLLKTTIDAAQKMGLKRIELNVRETNTVAIALYKKIGFKIEGVLENAIYLDGAYVNNLAMAVLFK
jgi:ribosomal protein S18 acetylase RimI-like enzyme